MPKHDPWTDIRTCPPRLAPVVNDPRARQAIADVRTVMDRHQDAGLADSEPRMAVRHWLAHALTGRRPPTMSFSYLQGFSTIRRGRREMASAIKQQAELAAVALRECAERADIELTWWGVEVLVHHLGLIGGCYHVPATIDDIA